MDTRERGETRPDLDGLSLSEAVAAVDDESADSGTVRETLAIVADDGVVRRTAVDDALAHATKVVTTAETRSELAATSLADVRDTAGPVSDLDIVAAHLDGFAARLERIEDRTAELGDHVQEIIDQKNDGDLYAIARKIRRVTATATDVQRAADDLQHELADFEAWLEDPARRAEEHVSDIESLEQSLDGLDDTVGELAADETELADDAAIVWARAAIQHRVTELMIADLQAELTTLQEWADHEGADRPSGVEPRLDELAARHDELAARHNALGERLAAHVESSWRERFGDRVAALDDALGEMEPPIAWDEVETAVDKYRPSGQ